MKKSQQNLTEGEILRKRADELLKEKSSKTSSKLSEVDTLKLINELEVHQIELEMQNEELIKAKEEADVAIQKYTELYDFAPTGYFSLSEEGKIIGLNLIGASILGKERQRLINNRFSSYVTNDTKVVFNQFLSKIFKAKDNESCEVTLSVEGQAMMMNVIITGVFDEKCNQCVLTMIDITGHKKAELALKDSEEKLRQLNLDKDLFISILAHDLRSPFNALLGLSELLTEDLRKLNIDEIENIAMDINKSAQNSFNLLEDLLMWARIQRGNIPFKPQILRLSDICKNVADVLKPSAEAKEIAINYSSVDQINVFADIDMLKTVLRNLVSNAIKFTNNRGAINISATQTDSNVTISVLDNGIGIKPENLTKLFDISQVLSTKGTAKETGTGLGLLLCKQFVEKHSGEIWVESTVEKGSIFHFTIPFNPISEEIRTTEKIINGKDEEFAFNSLKVLVAEDDEISNLVLTKIFQNIAKEILHAKTGVDAVETCRNNTDLDLVLMDMRMPIMDGYEATRQIRQFNKDLIIIAQTANAFAGESEIAIEAGCNDYISKPINKTLLYELIKKHCNKSNQKNIVK
jgi:PAS domain S-box-containing protein